MIVIDTSALVALFLLEDGHDTIAQLIDEADEALISVVSRVELAAVLCGRRIGAELNRVAEFVDALHLTHAPVSEDLMHAAIAAMFAYGKGRHPAGLNFGDCFSYALAKSLGAPLLYKGNDFSKTDVAAAWSP